MCIIQEPSENVCIFFHCSNVVSECIEEKNVSTADPDSLNSVSANFLANLLPNYA